MILAIGTTADYVLRITHDPVKVETSLDSRAENRMGIELGSIVFDGTSGIGLMCEVELEVEV